MKGSYKVEPSDDKHDVLVYDNRMKGSYKSRTKQT